MKSKSRAPCRHCGRVRAITAWGLCQTCWRTPAVYEKYAEPAREETDEDLDRLVAERMKDLPAWWEAERRKFAPAPSPPLLLLRLRDRRSGRRK